MYKILIADDHAIVREGLKQILQDSPDIQVAGEANSGKKTLQIARKEDFDLILLDIAMADYNGLEVLKDLRRERQKLPILMLSMYPEEQYAIRSLKAGANGYLTKGSAPDELIAAIRKVLRGGKYISSSLAEKMAWYLETDSGKNGHELLSDREYQVMLMIASGKKVSDIAEELILSPKTVSTNRSRALQKMGMKNNSEFVYYAIREGLIY